MNPYICVELVGSFKLVRDDLDVVDPLEHDRLPNFVDRASPLSKQREDSPSPYGLTHFLRSLATCAVSPRQKCQDPRLHDR